MNLKMFNELVKLEYPEWTGSYRPFIAGVRTACNAILINQKKEIDIIAIYSVNKSLIKVFIKKKSGDYLYGNGINPYINLTKEEFDKNVITT